MVDSSSGTQKGSGASLSKKLPPHNQFVELDSDDSVAYLVHSTFYGAVGSPVDLSNEW